MDKQAIEYALGQVKAPERISISSVPAVLAPAGWDVKSIEAYLDQPTSIRARVRLLSLESFVAYVNEYRDGSDNATAVFLDTEDGRFSAAIDYHGDEPSWCEHSATYTASRTREYRAWLSKADQPLDQVTLAELFERELATVHEPSQAFILDAVLKFELTADHAVSSSHDPDTGDGEFVFRKQSKTTRVDFPHRIKLLFPLFDNAEPALVEIRLQYRVIEGALSFRYSFVKDPEELARAELRRMADEIRAGLPGCAVYEGNKPEPVKRF